MQNTSSMKPESDTSAGFLATPSLWGGQSGSKIWLHSSALNGFSSLHSYNLTKKEAISPKPELLLCSLDKVKTWERENVEDIGQAFTNISGSVFSSLEQG